jgi:transcriptional regulator with XRE-family HTH domain
MNKRLLQFLSAENISQALFADTIQVARASVSHILAGRNKPGFDFIESMALHYPALNIEWLITGKGKMYKSSPDSADNSLVQSSVLKADTPQTDNSDNLFADDAGSVVQEVEDSVQVQGSVPDSRPDGEVQGKDASQERKISKVVIFYTDNTFQELI